MKPMKFQSVDKSEEIVVVCKSIFRVMQIADLPYGDEKADGQVYEYHYDVIINGEFGRLDEDELNEALEEMKFVEGE